MAGEMVLKKFSEEVGTTRGQRSKEILFFDETNPLVTHPIHKILHGLQINISGNYENPELAKKSVNEITGVMAYIETLENHISMMKDDVIEILDKYPAPLDDPYNTAKILTKLEVEQILDTIKEEVQNL